MTLGRIRYASLAHVLLGACLSPLSAMTAVEDAGLFGYVSSAGSMVVAAQYIEAQEFSGGLAAVRTAEGWGYISTNGSVVVPPAYEVAEPFSEGLARVRLNKQWSYISDTGVAFAAPERSWAFHGGLARFMENNLYGFLASDGQVAIQATLLQADDFSGGLAAVAVQTENGPRWGYADDSGAVVIPAQFSYAGSFVEGRACVGVGGRYRIIDTEGAFVGDTVFDDVTRFSPGENGLACIMIGRRFGYLNRSGAIAIAADYRGAQGFSEGLAAVQGENGLWTYIGASGEQQIETAFTQAGPFADGLAAVIANGVSCLIDSSGTVRWQGAAP